MTSFVPKTKLQLAAYTLIAIVSLSILWSYNTTDKAFKPQPKFAVVATATNRSKLLGSSDLWEKVVTDETVACRVYELPLVPSEKRHAPDRKPMKCCEPGLEPWVKMENDVAIVTRKEVLCEFEGDWDKYVLISEKINGIQV